MTTPMRPVPDRVGRWITRRRRLRWGDALLAWVLVWIPSVVVLGPERLEAAARLTAHGVVDLKATACKLSRRGRTVTAKLAFRLPKSLAGEDLRVDVQATDKHGHKQLEPSAGLIQVR